MKFKTWKDQRLHGNIQITRKVDGVRVHFRDGVPYSRADKILPGIPHGFVGDGIYEFYVRNVGTSVSIACSNNPSHTFSTNDFYMLEPMLDPRLYFTRSNNPPPSLIRECMRQALEAGWEGLVIAKLNEFPRTYYKVKLVETFDTQIIAIEGGKIGKQYEGMLGAFVTPMGKVGIGFTRDQRQEFYNPARIGMMIEVDAMGLTEKGKFRHARFKRFRPDLPAPSLPFVGTTDTRDWYSETTDSVFTSALFTDTYMNDSDSNS